VKKAKDIQEIGLARGVGTYHKHSPVQWYFNAPKVPPVLDYNFGELKRFVCLVFHVLRTGVDDEDYS
jgi:hypothetical protein